jgi:hypothetical protein
MLGQLAGMLSSVCRHNARHTGQESARQCPSKANDFSARFNRNSATPETTKQAAERKRSSNAQRFTNCLRTVGNPYLGITTELPVIRPGSMLSAEITSYKPTSNEAALRRTLRVRRAEQGCLLVAVSCRVIGGPYDPTSQNDARRTRAS